MPFDYREPSASRRTAGHDVPMSRVAVVGVSHTRTAAALRERLYVAPDCAARLARALAGSGYEAVVLATCNRTELYLTATNLADATDRGGRAFAHLSDGTDLSSELYAYADESAARHLFRVCAGLDATALGDTHISAQVRQAHGIARATGASGPLLDRMFEMAASASKRIRSETAISSGQTSIPAVAIAAAARLAGPLSERRLLVIGAGNVARLSALNAAWRGCRDIVVVNRGSARAGAVAERVGGRAVPFEALRTEVAAADIVISATAAPGFILTADHAAALVAASRTRPLVVFDLAIPRDIEPAVRDQPHTRLIDLDDLARSVATSGARRSAGLDRAEAIAREESERYEKWRRARAAVPAIVAMRGKAEQARRSILGRHAARLAKFAANERSLVEAITSELMAELLHEPTLELRRRVLERSD